MAVITKYVVVRNGVELDKEFLVKKEAEAYDKMLDAAENLAAFIKDADLDIALEESVVDAVSVFLAKNGPEVTRILKGLKPMAAPAKKPQAKDGETPEPAAKKKAPAAKPAPKGK
ncbi:YebG family protein [uncultured Desulfosarcina sp.]|uniref:YebG family protein n=1 Tax=uncultured Desulfosarcina sp. TaxID=218289 RepID=UPI0029C7A201|nr:YebG family protein [uncultured Desulfosarcina sp.]